MTRVNRTLRQRGAEGFYCTVAFAVFDFPHRRMVAGQLRPALSAHYRAAEGRVETIELAGLPLGTFDDATYEERVVPLGSGDVVRLLHRRRDRGASARATTTAPRGCAAQVEAARGRHRGRASGERILADVDAFLQEAPRSDDLTLVVVKVR